MGQTWRVGAFTALAVAFAWACGDRDLADKQLSNPPPTGEDAGPPDAGPVDAGPPDAGPSDAGGTDGDASDGGTSDAGTDAGSMPLPTVDGWKFYGGADGVPGTVNGVTADATGNIWVAGGEEGLFVFRAGGTRFERFTLADGLHPYGYLPDGGDVPAPHYLNVISVSGGPANTVFVGYQGRTTTGDTYQCEDNWDNPATRDPTIYKSGDADRVTLTPNGLSVVHYDIFSGPGMVAAEPEGRERLCNILRITYDASTHSVWFGGNHGFAWGDPDFPGIRARGCTGSSYGAYSCSGVLEHAHPAFGAYTCEQRTNCYYTITDAYRGIAPEGNGKVWVGGYNRSLSWDFGFRGDDLFRKFWAYESQQFDLSGQLDIWPDAAKQDTTPSQRKDDNVSGMAAAGDGTAWVSSGSYGVAHLSGSGSVLGYLTDRDGLVATQSTSIAADANGSIWVGGDYGGISRIQGGRVIQYGWSLLGPSLTSQSVTDIQVDRSSSPRRVLAGFRGGVIGVYTGP